MSGRLRLSIPEVSYALSSVVGRRQLRTTSVGPDRCRITGKQEVTDYFLLADIAQRHFAKRFERGKLTFTGDVLQVIFVSGRQQKFGKLLKRLAVGA